MKRSVLLLTILLIVSLTLAACGRPKAPADWDVTVEVDGRSAIVSITVPDFQIGRDYHPHLRLNGGPEVMVYQDPYIFRTLSPGQYELWVEIADPRHNPFPGLEPRILTFEIK